MELSPGGKQPTTPGGWNVVDMSDLCTLQRGFDITEATTVAGNVPVYSSSGLSYYHNQAMVSPPGVVTGRKGILGKVFLINEPFWPHDTTLWVKDFKGNHPAYVALVLEHFHLERLDAATSVPTLNRNNLAGYQIAIPATEVEQEAIAEALSDADALIQCLEQLITKKHHVKQGAMHELLSGKKRLPGFQNDWVSAHLGDFCKITTGNKDVNEGNPDGSFPFFTCSRSITFSDSYSFDTEAILVAGNGDVGTRHYYSGKFEAYQRTYVLHDFQTNARYLDQYLDAHLIASLVVDRIGTSIPYIKLGNLRDFQVRIPQEEAEVTAIAAILGDMDAEIGALETKLAKTRQLKQGMMRELLTGKVRLV